MAEKLTTLELEIKSTSSGAAENIDRLVASLEKLKSVVPLNNVNKSLNALSNHLSKIASSNAVEKLSQIADALAKINNNSSNIKDVSKEMAKLPKAIGKYDYAVGSVSNQKGLKNNLIQIGAMNISAMSLYHTFRRLAGVFGGAIDTANSFIENMNVFTVAMGEFADEEYAYAEKVQDMMGIDTAEWTKNIGILTSMARGFGLTGQQAKEMGKGMTELAYDFSSFFNLKTDEAFTKIRSALAGEIEPMRQLGVSLTEATMKEYALSKGITKNVEAMTESEKAVLRYNVLVQQASQMGVVGDLAKTLSSPANAIRILKSEIIQLSRAFGNLFIPMLTAVIPYIQAFVRVVTEAVSWLAALFGFEMPKWDTKDWDSATDSIEGTTEAVKEAKKQLAGFDELNVLTQSSSGSSNGATAGGVLDKLDISSVWDESIFDSIENRARELEGTMKAVLGVAGAIGTAFMGWKLWNLAEASGLLASNLFSITEPITLASLGISTLQVAIAGIVAILVGSFVTLYQRSEEFRSKVNELISLIGGTFTEMWGKVKKAVGIVMDTLSELYEQVLKPLWNFIVDLLEPAWNLIIDALTYLWKYVIDPIIDVIGDTFISVLEALKRILVEIVFPAVRVVIDVLDRLWKAVIEPLANYLNQTFGPVFKFVFEFVEALIRSFGAIITSIINGATELLVGFASLLGGEIKKAWNDFWDWLPKKASQIWEDIKRKFGEIVQGFKDFGRNIMTGLLDGLKGAVGHVTSGITDLFSGLFGSGLRDTIASVTTKLATSLKSAFTVRAYATGGFPSEGQLFVARESGPEMVGSIGGRTAVANNDDIVNAVSIGVAQAVASVLGNGNGQNVTITLDGKVLATSVIKNVKQIEANTGRSVFGY